MTTRFVDQTVTVDRSSAPPAARSPQSLPTVRQEPPKNAPGAAVWEVPLALATGALGLALGIANQDAVGTDMSLRVPALLAALLMVGQAVLNLTRVARGVQPVKRRVSPAVPAALIGLGAWLGWADLRIDAPDALMQLSLASAFVLFALGWWLLGDRT